MEICKFNEIIAYLKEIITGTPFYNHVYAVGGCVRDMMMGNPIKDIDIAIDQRLGGISFGVFLNNNYYLARKYVNYEAYGVCQFVLDKFPDVEIEAVQTRAETYNDPKSRNPITAFGSIEEDCIRRDLTINSLYMNIATGEILDFTGKGIEDIKKGFIRTPLDPEETFDDDPLRMLRVIRFMSRFNFNVVYDVYEAIEKKRDRLNIISVERINDELVKMLSDINAPIAADALSRTGLLQVLFPELDTYAWELHDCMTSLYKLHKFGYKPKLVYLILRSYKNDADKAKMFLQKLKFSNSDIKFMMNLFTTVNRFMDNHRLKKYENKDLYREIYLAGNPEFIEITIAIYNCLATMREQYYTVHLESMIVNCIYERGSVNFFDFELPLTGDEIMNEFNMKPGPEIRRVKELALEWCFENPLFEKEDMMQYLKDVLM